MTDGSFILSQTNVEIRRLLKSASCKVRHLLVTTLLACSAPAAGQESDAKPAVDLATNSAMTAIYDADQAAREHPTTIDWKMLRPADQARRVQTQALLDAGKLNSADDFYHAAYVFQHGDEA